VPSSQINDGYSISKCSRCRRLIAKEKGRERDRERERERERGGRA